MKLNKKRLSIVLFVTFVLTLAACGSSNTSEDVLEAEDDKTIIRFSWWGNDERHNLTQEAIELFEEKNPDIVVKSEFTNWDSYWDRLTTQAAGGDLPDLIQMSTHRLDEYISRDIVLDLNDFIGEGTINMENVSSVYQDMNILNGSTYAVSAGSNALAVVYNMDKFEEYGIELDPNYTYDDLFLLRDEISEKDLSYILNIGQQNEHEIVQHFARQYGEHLYKNGQIGIEAETLKEFLTIVIDMVDKKVSTPLDVSLENRSSGASMVANEEVIMDTYGSNQLLSAQEMATANLGLMPLPSVEGAEASGDWLRPAMSLSIASTSGTKEQEAAAKLIDFLTNDLEGNKILRAERGVPISSKVREGLYSEVDETAQKTFDFLELLEERAGVPEPLPPAGQAEAQAAFDRMVENIIFGEITIDEGIESFLQEAEQIFN